MPLIESGGVEVVKEGFASVSPGGTGWRSLAISLGGDTYDANTHTAKLVSVSSSMYTGYAFADKGSKFALNSGGTQIDLSTYAVTNTALDFQYQILKISGLSAPISRQQITKTINAYPIAEYDLTISDPGGDYEKSHVFAAHNIFEVGLMADSGASAFYHWVGYGGPLFKRTSATNIKVEGHSYTAQADYTFWVEIWPFG